MSLRVSAAAVLAAGIVLLSLMARQPGLPGSAAADRKNLSTAPRTADTAATPVLVELFTSEGCSSCPPADALLSRLGRTQPVHGADIIALEEHVNYWDNLGWKDPFSSDAVTVRQSEYCEAFGGKEIYTPQMIVDGRAEFVGSSDSDALRAIRTASQASKPAVQLSWERDDTLAIHMEPLTNAGQGDSRQLFLAIAEDMLYSDVNRGENSGRGLEHNGVVRQLLPLGKIDAKSSGFSSTFAVHPARDWKRANLRAVVFVQERRSRHIITAAAIPFPG